jgi:hypothetical protein
VVWAAVRGKAGFSRFAARTKPTFGSGFVSR